MSKNLPLRGRCPEGAEGENLAIARNISDSRTVLSPTACGRSPLAEGAKGLAHLFRQAEPSPLGEGGPAGPDEGQVSCSCPQTGDYGRLAPHQSVVGATDSFPHRGSQYNKKPPLPGKRSGGFALAYTRPTYLLYHFYYVLFNPDYAQILHIKVVRSANRRNLRAVV